MTEIVRDFCCDSLPASSFVDNFIVKVIDIRNRTFMFSFTVSVDTKQSWWARRTLLELRLLMLLLIILIIAIAMVIVAAATTVALAKSREYRKYEWSLMILGLFRLACLGVFRRIRQMPSALTDFAIDHLFVAVVGRQIERSFSCLNTHTVHNARQTHYTL